MKLVIVSALIMFFYPSLMSRAAGSELRVPKLPASAVLELREMTADAIKKHQDGLLDDAVLLAEKAAQFAQRNPSIDDWDRRQAATNLAALRALAGDLETSEKELRKIVEAHSKSQSSAQENASTLEALAVIARYGHRYEEAKNFILSAYEVQKSAKSEDDLIAYFEEKIGDIDLDMGQHDLAIERFVRAYAAWSYRFQKIRLLKKLATAYDLSGNRDAAEKALATVEELKKLGREMLTGQIQTIGPESIGAKNCVRLRLCIPVKIYFGTERTPNEEPYLYDWFSEKRDNSLHFGNTVVTVPRAFHKTGEISEPSWWSKLTNKHYEDATRYFTIDRSSSKRFVDEKKLSELVHAEVDTKDEPILLFVHGFRNSFESALYRLAQIAVDTSPNAIPNGQYFLFSWASANDAKAYVYDQDTARLATENLAKFIKAVGRMAKNRKIQIIAHSMGCIPTIKAIADLSKEGLLPNIENIIFAAPDVDKDEFKTTLAGFSKAIRSTTLYAASNDRALFLSRLARRYKARAGDVVGDAPIILSGVDSIDISTVDDRLFSWNHDRYANSKILVADIERIFRTGERPPSSRNVNFRTKQATDGVFWRYSD